MRHQPSALLALLVTSALTAWVTLPACDSGGSGAGGSGSGSSGATGLVGDPPPPAMVGTWSDVTNTTLIDFYNPNDGSWSQPSFIGTALLVYEDSTYLMGTNWTLSAYGCTYKLASTQKGVMSVGADVLDLVPNDGDWWTEHTCGSNDDGDESLDPTSYRYNLTGNFYLELWDTSLPDPDPTKGLVGAPCTSGADCLGGYCLEFNGYQGCAGHCSDAVGCTFLEKRDLTCAEMYDCALSCSPGGDGYTYALGDIQGCGDGCWARATPDAQAGYAAISECAYNTNCADDACFLEACGAQVAACTQ